MSWGIALIVGGLAFYYYNAQSKPQLGRTRAASVADTIQAAVKPSRKREDNKTKPKNAGPTSSNDTPRLGAQLGNDVSGASSADSGKKRKITKRQQDAPPAPPATTRHSPLEQDNEDDEDNKAWAQNLVALKKGTSLAPPSRTDSRNRTVKQSSAKSPRGFASTSDADDDLTPALSPALAAGDVSDMLESTSSGPSVLRLTESSKPAKAKQQRQPTSDQTAESKKQRQNRQKVEDRRLQREAEEKDRLQLLETQRRVAREARGEPAKNGIVSSKPPAASEWAVRAAIRATQSPTEPTPGSRVEDASLLDTFERHDAQRSQNGSLPSEEDQMSQAKKLSEDESGWNTVPKGKKQKKKAGTTEPNGSDGGYTPSTSYEQTSAPVQQSAPTPASTISSKPTDSYSNGYQSLYSSNYDAGSHPDDSQWSA